MQRQFAVALLFSLLTPLTFSQKVIIITNDNLAGLRAKYGPQFGPKPWNAATQADAVDQGLKSSQIGTSSQAIDATASTAASVQIGTFSDIMFTNGEALYEFDWSNPLPGCEPPYTQQLCQFYTEPTIQFQNITVYVRGTSLSFGSINENEALGVAFLTDSSGSSTLDNCQPLTSVSQKTVKGDLITTYSSNCVDIALQLQFSTDPYTLTLLDGSNYSSLGIDNTFITPASDHSALYTQCDESSFCKGTTVPVLTHKTK
jgi:hypothetical protein